MITRARFLFPAALAAVAAGPLAGCNADIGSAVSVRDQGVPLAELDRSGAAPTHVLLAGPDTVILREGPTFDIAVSGDPAAVAALRFRRDDGALAISRENRSRVNAEAEVIITMPAPRELTLAGSGDLSAPALVGDAEVTLAGSGRMAIARVAAETLEVSVLGSGNLRAAGFAQRLELTVAGSGSMDAGALRVGAAEVDIVGSGASTFASDGKVTADIAGSGDVRVIGNASCTVNKVGSGAVRCGGGTTLAR